MKIIKQMLIILTVTFLGELIRKLIPLSIPPGIYGLVILFTLLCLGAVKTEDVREVSVFLIEIMPLLIVPSGVGLINQWKDLRTMLVPAVIIMLVSTVLVFGAAGAVTQWEIRRWKKK